MKILLVGNYDDAQESMRRFAAELDRGVRERGHDVRLLRPTRHLGRLLPSVNGIGKWLGYVDRFVVFPSILRRALDWPDLVHVCDQANAIYVKHLTGCPHIVTCHDMLAIRSALGEISQNPTRWTGRYLQRMILDGLRRADRVVCVSEATNEDLLRVGNLRPDRVGVVPNGLNYPYRPMDTAEAKRCIARLGLADECPFFIHVGGNEWYKNRFGLLRIFSFLAAAMPSCKLAMVGKPMTAGMKRFVSQEGLERRVIELHGVVSEDLRALYSVAQALLFPSLYEGFGWPIIEAQACGCPVVTSNRRPMTDVSGDAALYIDPEKPEVAARTIVERLPKLASLREDGQANAARFSSQQMIEGYMREYQALLSYESGKARACESNAGQRGG